MGFEVTEDPECAGKTARCNTFKLLAYLEEQRLFVIKHAWLKRVDYILVSSVSGVASVFDAFPYISPDGKFVFGHGLYEIVGEDKPGPLKGQPRIDVWTRAGWRYVPHWEGAPHKQEHGKQVYKFDRWIAKTYQLKTNQTILEAHLEVDGKTAARFQLRDSNGPEEMEVVDLP
jgi:hypothetical protein